LISLGRRKPVAEELPEDALERLIAAAWSAFDAGRPDTALIYLVSLLDEFVRDAAIRHRIKWRDLAGPAIVHNLVFTGVVSEETADALYDAWKRLNAIVHGHLAAESPGKTEIARLIAACRDVQVAMRLEAA
jgi:hypothetical protein